MRDIQPYQIGYYQILSDLIDNPDKKINSRVGEARSRFSEKLTIDLKKEFPLMEIKQVSFKNVLVELLWFLKGDTNIKYLVDNNCNIWNDDAYRWYNEKYVPQGCPKLDKNTFISWVRRGLHHEIKETVPVAVEANFGFNVEETKHVYTYGDLDIVYGRQWRSFGGKVDQIKDVINMLRKNPDDRRMIVLGHNPADIADGNVGLPACHNYMQFYSQPIPLNKRVEIAREKNLLQGKLAELAETYVFYKFGKRKIEITNEILDEIHARLDSIKIPKRYLSLELTIRSNDFFLGNPYNIASYATLAAMIGQCTDMIPHLFSCEMVDCHLYEKHLDAAKEWIDRFQKMLENPEHTSDYCSSKLHLTPDILDIDSFDLSDFHITNYKHQGKIEAPLLT